MCRPHWASGSTAGRKLFVCVVARRSCASEAELGIAAGSVYKLTELNRKSTSCPVLLTWDGERFVFVTDFLGAGSMGESGPDGSTRPPRPEESVKIEPGRLVPKDGHYVIKIAEPMDEVMYLDHLRLDVIDHPADTHVFPDERFTSGPPEPTQQLLAFRTRHFPKLATDHKGLDVTKLVSRPRPPRFVDTFLCRSWLGYAEDHSLTLDFPELPAGGKWYMVLAGWTEYPFPESIYAATRAGIELAEPKLERFDAASGKWVSVCDLGFPAGLPRVMTRELPPDFRGGKLRISTNMPGLLGSDLRRASRRRGESREGDDARREPRRSRDPRVHARDIPRTVGRRSPTTTRRPNRLPSRSGRAV